MEKLHFPCTDIVPDDPFEEVSGFPLAWWQGRQLEREQSHARSLFVDERKLFGEIETPSRYPYSPGLFKQAPNFCSLDQAREL